ncbi:unnamed protein product, partial [Mesorhabditis belari]|uniref:Cytochrome P450 n=1 Tax=Mesorhabditis belari TaxID=2138241 RepID=A0AAF3FK48_9BILA
MLTFPLVIIAFLGWLYQQFVYRRKFYPPGPMPLPFIGNFHQINLANPARSMLKWRERYGPVFTVWLPKPIVVLATHKTLQEALVRNGDAFAGRPTSFLYSIFTKNRQDGDGIILCQKERWSVNRAFALRVFRDCGMGRDVMAEKILIQAETLVNHLKERIGDKQQTRLNPHHPLAFCVGNIIHDLIIGRTYPYGDSEFERFKFLIDSTLKDVASWQMQMVDSYPFLAEFFSLFRRYKKNGFALQQFFLDEIERHDENLSEDGDPRDFMEAYLREMKRQPENPHFNKLTLALTSGDLWTGGMETSVTTLRWAIIFLMYHPHIQKRLHDEIDQVLGDSRATYSCRNQMPYTMATLSELQRICNVLPWHIPHRVLRNVTIEGVLLKEGTDVMPQFGAVHTDPKAFDQPDEFRPERFLDSNGHFCPRVDMNPFGLGKRACLGENLARYELFLLFVTILQEFQFERIEGHPLPSLARSPGMTSVPKEFECQIRARRPQNPKNLENNNDLLTPNFNVNANA